MSDDNSHDVLTEDEEAEAAKAAEDHRLVRDAMLRWSLRDALLEHGAEIWLSLLDDPEIDEYGVVTIGSWGGWLVQVMPMAFNDRLVLTPKCGRGVYDYGWCYPKGPAAFLAALAWNPETQGEPRGFIKRIGVHPRPAGTTGCCGDR